MAGAPALHTLGSLGADTAAAFLTGRGSATQGPLKTLPRKSSQGFAFSLSFLFPKCLLDLKAPMTQFLSDTSSFRSLPRRDKLTSYWPQPEIPAVGRGVTHPFLLLLTKDSAVSLQREG